MTRTRSGRGWWALAVALALLAGGAAEAQPKSYRFGAVLPLTGNSATAGEWMRKGTEVPEAIGPRYDAFLAAFNARYKIPLPDYAAAGYYDSTEIFAAALRYALGKGWEYTGDNIRKALLEMPPLEGVFGKTQFARDGTVRKAISIKTFRGGKPAVVKAYSLDEVLRMQ